MEMPTFIYKVLPSKKKEELISKRNVRVIKEYLMKREKLLETAKKDAIANLKQLRKGKSISVAKYRHLKQVMVMASIETKRIELIKASIEKSVKLENSIDSCDDEPIKIINY